MEWDAGHQLRLACTIVGLLFALGVGGCGGEEEQPTVSSTQLRIGGDPTPPEDPGDSSTTGEGGARDDAPGGTPGGQAVGGDDSGSRDVAEPVALPEPRAARVGPIEPALGPSAPEPPRLAEPVAPPRSPERELESPAVDVFPAPPVETGPPVEPGRPDPCEDQAGSHGVLAPVAELIGPPASCGEQGGLLHGLLEPVGELLPNPSGRRLPSVDRGEWKVR